MLSVPQWKWTSNRDPPTSNVYSLLHFKFILFKNLIVVVVQMSNIFRIISVVVLLSSIFKRKINSLVLVSSIVVLVSTTVVQVLLWFKRLVFVFNCIQLQGI